MKTDPPALDAVLERLRAFRQAFAPPLSYRGLAKLAGLSPAALIGMDKPEWAPSSTTIRALEALVPEGWQAGQPLDAEQVASRGALAA